MQDMPGDVPDPIGELLKLTIAVVTKSCIVSSPGTGVTGMPPLVERSTNPTTPGTESVIVVWAPREAETAKHERAEDPRRVHGCLLSGPESPARRLNGSAL